MTSDAGSMKLFINVHKLTYLLPKGSYCQLWPSPQQVGDSCLGARRFSARNTCWMSGREMGGYTSWSEREVVRPTKLSTRLEPPVKLGGWILARSIKEFYAAESTVPRCLQGPRVKAVVRYSYSLSLGGDESTFQDICVSALLPECLDTVQTPFTRYHPARAIRKGGNQLTGLSDLTQRDYGPLR
ncbi:uncharacterized protein B0H18DRAFT_959590 [Fomitopsis serialis]|uniref:uncharacterized protein n=1 Tax=Fomitopsis serialis TaxID=139415 RepID=UPI0020079834|nr:uncharacterized protein B0H18DRAFT_959590 [Neoantrodia serialis]KAH9914853.1 hypothetical protein B0H18DRAFT_959590 [Neoantrodia serialis]